MIARFLVWLVLSMADRDLVPRRFGPTAGRGGIFAIKIYRRYWSARSGRTCLFAPSCSERAILALQEFGWRRGLAETAQQLRRCGGTHSIAVAVDGTVILTACDGATFRDDDLSPALRQRRRA